MSIKRYVAVTNREALAQVRRDLGDDAVILSNKRIAGGRVQIVAAAPDAMEALVRDARASRSAARAADGVADGAADGVARGAAKGAAADIADRGAARATSPARTLTPMAGESFQQFVRRQSEASTRSPSRAAARGAPIRQAAAAMYSEVAATAPVEDSSDDGWTPPADSWTPPEDDWTPPKDDWTPPAWAADALAGSAQGSAERSAAASSKKVEGVGRQPARAPAAAREGGTDRVARAIRPAVEPAVFRRRPSRESIAGALSAPAAGVAPAVFAAPVSPVESSSAPMPARDGPPDPVSVSTPVHAAGTATTTAQPATEPTATGVQIASAAAGPQVTEHPGDRSATPAVAADAPTDGRLLAELQSLRAALHEQWVTLSSSVAAADVQRRHPLQARLMTRLLTSGFTPEVARRIALHAPDSIDATGLDTWLQDVLTVNLRCASETDAIVERGGAFALVGPTGVGKTTTVAKLAARFAVRHGTSALGLITLDAYRIAAHEQLRSYGRILGVPVHLAQDGATLRELLASMHGRRLVLIDTCGVGPRDARLAEMLGTLAQADTGTRRVQPVLLLHAASHAETLEDTARAWRSQEAAGCILTKLDEAARIGGALDCAMRHKLTVLALTNGQRVPEDLHLPNARLLAHLSLKPAGPLFALDDHEGAVVAHATALS